MLRLSIRTPCLALTLCGIAVLAGPAGAVMPTRQGTIPAELAQGFEARWFDLPAGATSAKAAATQAVWNVPVILVGFADQPLGAADYGSLTPRQHFDQALFDTTGVTPTGSVFDYYTWVSEGRIRVVGRVVATITLPQPKDYYANNSWGLSPWAPRNAYGFVSATLQAADLQVDWTAFDQNHDTFIDMLWVVHSGIGGESSASRDNLWSITSRLSNWSGGDAFETHSPVPGSPALRMRIDRFSVLPELSARQLGKPSEIGVYCHEFGHALGLPDLYDTSSLGGGSDVGLGNWSLMATGAYGTDGLSPQYPGHLGAWPMLWLGWRNAVRPTADSLMIQGPLASGAPVVEFWCQGEANYEHFLIENRQRLGFDRNLPSEGLIVYQVDETIISQGLASNQVNYGNLTGVRLIEADGYSDLTQGINRGDARDPFPGLLGRTEFNDFTLPSTRSIRGVITNIALSGIEPAGDDMRYHMQVRPPGWQPVVGITSGVFNPIWPSGSANRGLRLADGSVTFALSEVQAGVPQILLRTRSPNGPWEGPVQVSESPTAASDASIAALPGNRDLVATWSDTRHGSAELYFRSRVGGVWSPEYRLTNLAGSSRHPSVGVDRSGRVHVAWQYHEGPLSQVRFMSFTYLSPFGSAITLSSLGTLPDPPVVAVAPGGTAHIFWVDRTPPASAWFARYTPSVGFALPQRVAASGLSQSAIDAAVDARGDVHVAWQESGAGANQIHYQRRPASEGPPSPLDTVVVSRTQSVQNPVLRVDNQFGLHLAFIAQNAGVQQVRYKRRQADVGWDYTSTEISMVADGSTARPLLVPDFSGDVSVLYFGFIGGTFQQLERRRVLNPAVVAVSPSPVPAPPGRIRLGPNPLRAGAPLTLELAAGAVGGAEAIDIFDLAGRRMTSAPITARGEAAHVEIPGAVTGAWPSGVYFVRPRGGALRPARLVVLR